MPNWPHSLLNKILFSLDKDKKFGICFFIECSTCANDGPYLKFQNPRKTFENPFVCLPKYSTVQGDSGSKTIILVGGGSES